MVPPPDTSKGEAESAHRWLGRELGGRYKVLSLMGQGSAGYVFRAIQSPLGRVVAVKVLRPDLSAYAKREFGRRFIREAAVMSRLSHPNIVIVHDYGVEDDGTHFVVMELLKGRTLRRALREGRFTEEKTIQVSQGICKGLRHAHGQGVIHRDIKPGNIFLITNEDGDEVPILLDFGIVKLLEGETEEATAAGTYLGTPAYMAPEQAMSEKSVDHRADLYSLGCLMFRMLSGERPYGTGNALAMALKHQRKPIPKFSSIQPPVNVSPALESIVYRAMAKRPKDRFDDAHAMFNALEAIRTGKVLRTPSMGVVSVVALSSVSIVALLAVIGVWVNNAESNGGGEEQNILFEPSNIQIEEADVAEEQSAAEQALGSTQENDEEAPRTEAGAGSKPIASTEASAPPEQRTVDVAATKPAPPAKPAPSPKPAPQPPARVAEEPKPTVAPAPKSTSSNTSDSTGESRIVVEGNYLDAGQAEIVLRFVNTATEEELRASGMVSRSVGVILSNRPFESLEAFADTSYIGPKTVESVIRAATK